MCVSKADILAGAYGSGPFFNRTMIVIFYIGANQPCEPANQVQFGDGISPPVFDQRDIASSVGDKADSQIFLIR